ncbi:Aste57867_23729 [Aphanomyces stellatus]|uniref:Aste57867_23729 protein n=1 Tax=Aphanomyces stellatus TaxID=120398 RepID=A0A485LNJ7_9STRA|nr:hypothetical protein As57867_023657 [Aphanomyces stellatus]VFU00374.1 Aste57867_23729 [Aphanomyces stellatus]
MTALLGDDWNIMEDLQFLIANDNELEDGISRVCDMLDDGDSGGSDTNSLLEGSDDSSKQMPTKSQASAPQATKPSESKRKPRARTTFEVRQKEEMQRLRDEVERLKEKLRIKEAAGPTTSNEMTFWESAAKLERVEKIKAVHENELLREAVDQQATFIEQMQKVFTKKPRLTHHRDIHSEEWQAYRLAAQTSLRTAAIHAIADRQFNRMQNAYLRAGLWGCKERFSQSRLLPQADGTTIIQFANHVVLGAPFRHVAAAMLRALLSGVILAEGMHETIEHIDARTVYGRARSADLTWHSNLIRRNYSEPDREVFVARTVLDDALVPQMATAAVESKSAWVQIARHPDDDNQCHFSLLIEADLGNLSSYTTSDGDDLNDIMKKLTLSPDEVKPGQLPTLAAFMHVDPAQLPQERLRMFLHIGRNMSKTMARVVNSAIDAHSESQSTNLYRETLPSFLFRNIQMAERDAIESWDSNLQFLIANDVELDEALKYVWTILKDDGDASATTNVETSSVPRPKKTRPRTTFEIRQREEINQLRGQVNALKATLCAAEAAGTIPAAMPFWERTAKVERMEMHKAQHENEQLREAVGQQATFIQQMQRVFRKKPRLTLVEDIASEEWQSYRLAAKASLRTAAIHAIADRQFHRMQNAFLRAGVLDCKETLYRSQLLSDANGASTFQLVNHINLAAPFDVIGVAIWRWLSVKAPREISHDASIENFFFVQEIECIDEHTVYTRAGHLVQPWQSNLIRKRYPQSDRVTFVARSVLEDALIPHAAMQAQENKSVWLHVTRLLQDDKQCQLTLLVEADLGRMDSSKTSGGDDLVNVLGKLAVRDDDAKKPGYMPLLPAYVELDPAQLPHESLRLFMESGKHMQKTLLRTVNSAIDAYRASEAAPPPSS